VDAELAAEPEVRARTAAARQADSLLVVTVTPSVGDGSAPTREPKASRSTAPLRAMATAQSMPCAVSTRATMQVPVGSRSRSASSWS